MLHVICNRPKERLKKFVFRRFRFLQRQSCIKKRKGRRFIDERERTMNSAKLFHKTACDVSSLSHTQKKSSNAHLLPPVDLGDTF